MVIEWWDATLSTQNELTKMTDLGGQDKALRNADLWSGLTNAEFIGNASFLGFIHSLNI